VPRLSVLGVNVRTMSDHGQAELDAVTRPRVIVSIIATVDGRVTLSRSERLLEDGPNQRWKSAWPPDVVDLLERRTAAIERRHHPTVVLEGSGTFVADEADALDLPGTNVPAEVLQTDFLPYRSPRWFAVVDARGRIAWTHKGDENTSLLVLASHSTPLSYLARLRQERIPYLLAGEYQVDLTHALPKIRAQLTAQCVVSEAVGGLNAALLRAGLVDELHIITIPALVGGLGTPSVMDGPPLEPRLAPRPAANDRCPGRKSRNHLGALRGHLGERDVEVELTSFYIRRLDKQIDRLPTAVISFIMQKACEWFRPKLDQGSGFRPIKDHANGG
jgi:2,5-diamino-6-(ribosylamino)-4(3H)-pyrimidinone 5'-phosphate reductase